MESLFGSSPAAQPATASGAGSSAASPPPPAPAAEAPKKLAFPEHKEEFPTAADAPFRPVLIIKAKDRDRGDDTYELADGQTLIGRAPENDIILLEESISRRHARIVVGNREVSFEDLGSANGSFTNGERLRPREPRSLHDNDVVKIGQLLALFRVNPDD